MDQGDDEIVFARIFDEHPVAGEHPEWPVQMEFSMTNSCNLQCVMCNGDWSSSIRAHREHRPPLPEVYGEAFFEELADFLPHLSKTNFLGGEPFLGKEPLRVLNMLAELDHPPDVAVTTNGTQWSPRIEQICERLPISFVLSLDGITKDTYEAIRVGADFDQVMANLDRFQSYARRNGTMVTLAHCLMRANWHEFSRLLRFAEDRGMEVGMNEVLFPVELSLFQLPPAELREVVETMERDDGGIAASLDLLRPVWDGQLAALRHRLESLEQGQVQFIRPWAGTSDDGADWDRSATATLTEWVGDETPARLTIDRGSDGAELLGSHERFFVEAGVLGARSADEVLTLLGRHVDPPAPSRCTDSGLVNDWVLGEDDGNHPLQLRVAWSDVGDRSTILIAVRNPPPPPVLPADPLAALTSWCDPDQILVLTCDADDRVVEVDGEPHVLGLDHAQAILGMTNNELVGSLSERFGPPTLRPGPSGLVADSVVTFGDEPSTAGTILRVMVDRSDRAAVVLIGRRDPLGTSDLR